MNVGGALLTGIVGQEVAELTGGGGSGVDGGVSNLLGFGGIDTSGNAAVVDALSAYYANAAGASAVDYANVLNSTAATSIDNLASMYSQLGMDQSSTAAAVANVAASYAQLEASAAMQSASMQSAALQSAAVQSAAIQSAAIQAAAVQSAAVQSAAIQSVVGGQGLGPGGVGYEAENLAVYAALVEQGQANALALIS